ncbi:MAG: hypothetical protein GW949_10645 [Spirochaetales bacterium]|nr:hypothetical protein [Spirochaetales bacterium]
MGSSVEVVVGEFDRNARTWPFQVKSNDPQKPYGPMTLVAQLGNQPNPQQAIIELNNAVQAGAIRGEIGWRIVRNTNDRRYEITVPDG